VLHAKRHHTTRRFGAATLALALLATVAVACSPTTPPPAPSGPWNEQKFCEFWDKVEATPPAADSAVLVKDDVVALAEDTTVTGQECTDSNARVSLDGATLAEGEEVPLELNQPVTEKVAAVTGDEIAAGAPVLENLRVQALSAEIGTYGIRLRGNVQVTLSGVTSTIGFVGTLSDLNNWSIQLSSSAFSIPGMTVSPVVFSGTLTVTNGVPSLSLSANASSVKIGDISVTGAAINLVASPATGVSASVAGSLKIGPSTASGNVAVVFDRAGALVSAKADISAHLVGTMAGGKKVDLQGSVKLDGNATETAISFSASGIVGDLQVNEANGSLTLGTNKATFIGVLDVQQGANTVRFDGSIVWDGITASTPYLSLQGAGDISGTLQDGQKVSVSGTIDTQVIGGQVRAVVAGTFQVGTLKAQGSAIVEYAGATTTLYVDAQLQDAGFAATLGGVVIITDGRAETVSLDAAVNGQVKLGDATLSNANLHIASTYGSTLDLDFSGHLAVGSKASLQAAMNAQFGPNGTLLSLTGDVDGTLLLDSWGILDFSGSVVANPDQITLTGAGGIVTTNFPLGITFNGSFTSRLDEPTWQLTGGGRFRIASINVASARLSLSQTAGMKATRVGFYFDIIGIPTYFEADFYLNASGGCSKVNVTGGSFLAKPILALVLPPVIGCPVNI
jgi:hypothetical protein